MGILLSDPEGHRGATFPLSFFDEDDEQTSARRRAPRPRRTTPAASSGGSGIDSQTLMMRRAIAIGGGLLLLVLLVVLVNACQDSRHKNALRDWNREATALVQQSDSDVGAAFFDQLRQSSSQSPEDLSFQVLSLRAEAEKQLERGEA